MVIRRVQYQRVSCPVRGCWSTGFPEMLRDYIGNVVSMAVHGKQDSLGNSHLKIPQKTTTGKNNQASSTEPVCWHLGFFPQKSVFDQFLAIS